MQGSLDESPISSFYSVRNLRQRGNVTLPNSLVVRSRTSIRTRNVNSVLLPTNPGFPLPYLALGSGLCNLPLEASSLDGPGATV